MIDTEIELMNRIINSAINYGGDRGGAYCDPIGWTQLKLAVNTWLQERGLRDQYHLIKLDVKPDERDVALRWVEIQRKV